MKHAVCLYTDNLKPSGLGEHMLALAAKLRRRYALSFVCPPSPDGLGFMARARAMGVETFGVGLPGNREGPTMLGGWLRARRVRIFHAHAGNLWEGHDGSVPVARAAGVPVVVRTEHLPDLTDAPWFDDAPWEHADYERKIEMVDRIICVSEEARASFVKRNVPAQKFRVVRNGIEPRPAVRSRARVLEGLDVPPQARVVLTVGKLTVRKGYPTLLKALPAVAEREPEAYFVWVGEGALKDELRGRARALGLDGRVRFAGYREDVPDLMAASDLFVLPSLAEALPLVVLEAMAAGLPVVGTRVCGTSEAVVDGVTGRLVAAGEANPLAAAIVEALESPRLAARWGAAGKTLAEREFGAGRMARETAEIYEELIREHAAAEVPLALTPTGRRDDERVATDGMTGGG